MMINVDPETAVQNPAVLRTVTQQHGECAGIYANVIVPGVIRVGDIVSLVSK
jgi:MOSC domain-containing protein YiiM